MYWLSLVSLKSFFCLIQEWRTRKNHDHLHQESREKSQDKHEGRDSVDWKIWWKKETIHKMRFYTADMFVMAEILEQSASSDTQLELWSFTPRRVAGYLWRKGFILGSTSFSDTKDNLSMWLVGSHNKKSNLFFFLDFLLSRPKNIDFQQRDQLFGFVKSVHLFYIFSFLST